jgi:peptidoglycan/LPS O-acetylase OafA/YrhL
MFFALSGFLVVASLTRSASLVEFATFRIVRLLPALATVVFMTAFVLGPLLAVENWHDYFVSKDLTGYLGNIIARPHYVLPGVFLHNPRAGIVNGSLWTIPVELWCYLGLAVASLLGLVQRKRLLALCAVFIISVLVLDGWLGNGDLLTRLPTGNLVLPFLTGVFLFAMADMLPCHAFVALPLLGIAVLLAFDPHWFGITAIALAYATIWAGLLPLPALPGDYSYGLYLVGYPLQQIYVSVFPGGPWWHTWFICLPTALGCAALLWHYVEKPVLARKARFVPRLSRLPSPRTSDHATQARTSG